MMNIDWGPMDGMQHGVDGSVEGGIEGFDPIMLSEEDGSAAMARAILEGMQCGVAGMDPAESVTGFQVGYGADAGGSGGGVFAGDAGLQAAAATGAEPFCFLASGEGHGGGGSGVGGGGEAAAYPEPSGGRNHQCDGSGSVMVSSASASGSVRALSSGKFSLRPKHPLSIRSSGHSSVAQPLLSPSSAGAGAAREAEGVEGMEGGDVHHQQSSLSSEPALKVEPKEEEEAEGSAGAAAEPMTAEVQGDAAPSAVLLGGSLQVLAPMLAAEPEYDDDYDE